MTQTQGFKLAVVRPVKGRPGDLVCNLTIFEETVSKAVAKGRAEVGADLLVLQAASYEASCHQFVTERMAQLHKEELEAQAEYAEAA